MRGALALGLALIARASLGASLDYCNGPSEPGAAAQDRLIQVAAVVKAELDQSGAQTWRWCRARGWRCSGWTSATRMPA